MRGLAQRAVSRRKAPTSQTRYFQLAKSPRFPVDVDLHRTGQQRTPGLQIGLHPRIAGDPLAIDLDNLVGVVFNFVNEPCRIIHILQESAPPPAEARPDARSSQPAA